MRTNEHSYRSLCHEIMEHASLELAMEGLRMTQQTALLADDLPALRKAAAKINEHAMMLEESKAALAWLEGLPDDLCPEVEAKTMIDVKEAAKAAASSLEDKLAKLPPALSQTVREIFRTLQEKKEE